MITYMLNNEAPHSLWGIVLLFIFFNGFQANALYVSTEWANRIGGNNGEESSSITHDANGNSYTTGQITSTVNFDPGVSNSTITGPAGFICKYDPDGKFVWVKGIGEEGKNVAISRSALLANVSGNSNVAIGAFALSKNTGEGNIGIGANSMREKAGGNKNIVIGSGSASGDELIGLGNNSVNGNNAIAIGNKAQAKGTNAIAIGLGPEALEDNSIRLGNSSILKIGGQTSWSTYSDGRIKTNIQKNVPGLAFVNKLKPVTYNLDIHAQNELQGVNTPDFAGKFDIESIKQTGFIAQEVANAAK